MRAPIAKIRISAGNPGWYDPLTNIHLTITRPDAFVYEGQNTVNVKSGVAHKLIYVLEGDLDAQVKEVPVAEEVREVVKPVEEKVEEKVVEEVKPAKVEEPQEEIKEEEPKVEEEKKPAKKTTKKKAAKAETEDTTK